MKTEFLIDDNFQRLVKRLEVISELLIRNKNEIVSITMTGVTDGMIGYYGVIFYKAS